MEHSPPPFFKRGPAPFVRLVFFASLSITLLVLDARFRYVDGLRSMVAVVTYPLQRAALAPVELSASIAEFFTSQSALREQNAQLKSRLLAAQYEMQRSEAAVADAQRMRRLLSAAETLERRRMPAEIIYASRDPFSQKVFVDKGGSQGVLPGSPVVDDSGVVGQVTRVHPMLAEVTLLTDKDQAIPVQVLRNGLRAVAFGGGTSGTLELRFMAANAEIQNGDRLVTSGIDGVYPAGLAVGTVLKIERDAAQSFARILCEPVAGIARGRHVLLLSPDANLPPLPTETGTGTERRDAPRRNRRKD